MAPHLTLMRDGVPAPADTTLQAAGGDNVLIISTTTPGLTLRSVYVGAEGTDSHITHLVLHRDRPSSITDHFRARRHLPVTHARQLCLTDHAATLRDVLGSGTTIDITDAGASAGADSL